MGDKICSDTGNRSAVTCSLFDTVRDMHVLIALNAYGQGFFEQTAVANKWENGRDVVILPTVLYGKLIDLYTLRSCTMKKALADRAGLTRDPLAAARKFGEAYQKDCF